jgi:hypothetical protein
LVNFGRVSHKVEKDFDFESILDLKRLKLKFFIKHNQNPEGQN